MTKRILIGDDQIGSEARIALRTLFEMKYEQAFSGFSLEYTADPEDFIEKASTGSYEVLFIDLKWDHDDALREYKTGYRILDAVREYAPKIILWTSEDKADREKGYEHGATHCIEKNPTISELEEILG